MVLLLKCVDWSSIAKTCSSVGGVTVGLVVEVLAYKDNMLIPPLSCSDERYLKRNGVNLIILIQEQFILIFINSIKRQSLLSNLEN